MTLTDHALWPKLLPLLSADAYDRDGGHKRPRRRLEVADPDDRALRAELLAIEVDCASPRCDRLIHPIREREGWRSLYLAVTCELETERYGCARGKAARAEYERLIDVVLHFVNPTQPTLFEAH